MPDIFGINFNGEKLRPTYEELINFVDYPVKIMIDLLFLSLEIPHCLVSLRVLL